MQSAHTQRNLPLYRTIQGQLIVWFLALGVIPLIIVGVVSFSSANTALRDSITNTLTGVANAKSDRLASWLQDTGRAAQTMAKLPGIRGSQGADNLGIQIISDAR